MADRIALGRLGLTFGAVTGAVMLIAFIVAKAHMDGRLSLDGEPLSVTSAALSVSAR